MFLHHYKSQIHFELSSRTHDIMVIGVGSLSFLVTIIWRLQTSIVNGIGANDPCGLNKGCGLKFPISSRVQQETPEEGQRTYQPKHCDYCNKDDGPKTLNDKKKNLYNFFFLSLHFFFSFFFFFVRKVLVV